MAKARGFLRQIYTFLIKPVVSKLDFDNQLSDIRNYDYIDAHDISAVSQGANSQLSIQPYQSDKYAYTIPAVTAQNKIYQVIINAPGDQNNTVQVFDTNGNQVGSDVTYAIDFDDPATTYTNFVAAFNAQIASLYTISYAHTISGNILTITITFTDVLGYDWFLSSSSIPTTIVNTLAEAIDLSIAGESQETFSWQDSANNLFLWSTPCQNLPIVSTITVSALSNVVGTRIRLTVSTTTGLTTGESINLSGALGTDAASVNGTWIINVIDGTHIDLYHSTYTGNTLTAYPTITLYVNGYGKTGVAVKDLNLGTWVYYDLLRARELNFRTLWQQDGQGQVDNQGWDLKWCDFNNPDRVFYYNNAEQFVLDGAITALHSLGNYQYGEINNETALVQNVAVGDLLFTGQTVGGGSVKSGNWRYGVRGVTFSGGDTSPVTYMDTLVNVYAADQTVNALLLQGNSANTTTSKINNFTLKNIPTGVYKYVELVATNYLGLAEVSYVITRLLLPTNTSDYSFSHTGNEIDTILLSPAELAVINETPTISKNLRLLQNRCVRSNLKQTQEADFTAWAQTFSYSVNRTLIDGVGIAYDTATGHPGRYGEYFDPSNVCFKIGYMHNETYRFGVIVHLKNQGWTPAFWVADININVANGLPDYDLTTNNLYGEPNTVYVAYVNFSNINLDYIIDGQIIRDIVDKIEIVRVDMVANPNFQEILGTGIESLCISGIFVSLTDSGYDIGTYGEQIQLSQDDSGYAGVGMGSVINRKLAGVYFMDSIFGNTNILQQAGDKIFNYGARGYFMNNQIDSELGIGGSEVLGFNGYIEFNGYGANATIPQTLNVNSGNWTECGQGDNVTIGGQVFSKKYTFTDGIKDYIFYNSTSYALATTVNMTASQTAMNKDLGVYYVQYYRQKTNKFGNSLSQSIYITTGAVYEITATSPTLVSLDVFGGDTFTQKGYFKATNIITQTPAPNATAHAWGFGWYGQNRVNQQMRNGNSGTGGGIFPAIGGSDWLDPLSKATNEIIAYNQGYTPRNQDQTEVAFDPNNPVINLLPTRIAYSLDRPNDSQVDTNRVFLPLNFYDLDVTNGAINHMELFNGELITYQPTAMRHPYFNTTGKFQIGNAGDIITGDGGIMTRTPATPTKYGLSNKWAFIKGKSETGDDVHYWIDTKMKKVFRFAGDGVRCISDITLASNWFANNLQFAQIYDTPAHGEGIHGVYDERHKEAIFVVRASKNVSAWIDGTYAIGNEVSYGTQGFNQVPQIWVSKVNSNTHTPAVGAYWTQITLDNNLYYNQYSIVYSEYKHGFTTFKTELPKIFTKFNNGYLYPQPISNLGLCYEAYHGNSWLSWYDGALTSDGSITFVVNEFPETEKNFIAFLFNTKIIPYKIQVQTETMLTIINQSDINTNSKTNLSQYYIPILKDVATGSRMMGKNARITFYFQTGVYQELIDFTIRFSNKPRPLNT